MKKYIEQKGITYELRGEQYYPLLELPEQKEISKYGRLHLDYLKEEYMARHHDDLLKTMSDEQKEPFEKFHDCWSEYTGLAEAAIFEYAFKLGMQIAIETLTE